MLDVVAQNAPLRSELEAAFARVLDHGRFILGPEVEALEASIAERLGGAHCVGVSSGTDALLVALMALDVGPGDEVITTPFTFFATGGVIARLGATPVFVDVNDATFCLDLDAAAAAVGPKTRAVIPVHLFGHAQPLGDFVDALPDRVAVVEDAAQALGATSPDGPAGTVGRCGTFSFFPSKNLGGFGDGGLVCSNDAELAARLRTLRTHGAAPKYFHAEVGGNFRLDALQAALLAVKLPYLDGYARARRANAAYYARRFAEAGLDPERLVAPEIDPGHVVNQFVVRTSRRDGLAQHLREAGVASAIYYPRPLHRQACFASLGYAEGSLPVAERLAEEVLALPVHPDLTQEDLARVADEVIAFHR